MGSLYDLNILVVDDEPALCRMIREILFQAGFHSVRTAENYHIAREMFDAFSPDAVILDIMLPDGNGFDLMKQLRRERDVPVLFLSARDADEDRLHGLGLGADDYIVKPFLPQELILRLTAVLRRVYALRFDSKQLHLGNAVIDWASGTVSKNGKVLSLTAKEYALLQKLYENQGKIVSMDALCRAAWKEDIFGYENTLMVHIRRLREKIEEEPSRPQWLVTIRGLGYKLVKENMP